MKKTITIFLLLTFTSCTDNPDNVKNSNPDLVATPQVDSSSDKTLKESGIRVKVDFSENKDLLGAILLLPDSAFSTWEWKLEDRKSWYTEIKSNDFYTDNDPNFFTQTYFEPNSAKFTIVDGTWSISLYKNTDNSSIVITNDVAGDGNDINIYEIKANMIQGTKDLKGTFGDYVDLIKRKDGSQHCTKKYDEIKNDAIFSFNFSERAEVEIESSWSLLKDEYSDCLEGNSLLYSFNPDTKKFDLKKIYWKAKTVG
ncbi:MAG: hypothetical protein V4635_03630 [Bacteroidota bacterium]